MKQTDSFYADLYLYGRSLFYVGFDWKKTMNEKTGNTKNLDWRTKNMMFYF
jgi:hypothetical protein